MPTTRARRTAARAAALQELIELPADVLSLVLYQLPLAHDIAGVGLVCPRLARALSASFAASQSARHVNPESAMSWASGSW